MPGPSQMAEVARAYCGLIERVDDIGPGWLQQLADLLPRLHAAVSSLDIGSARAEEMLTPDLDARFELFSRLRARLGERDAYWMEFDSHNDHHEMSGSLADDLTDIYCELKQGLALFDSEPRRALDGWRAGYRFHWGRHLVDAQRHLYELRARDQLAL